MNIGIIGTGYVGLPTGVGLAELGHNVTCIDVNPQKISELNSGHITLYEDGLDDLFHENVRRGRLHFTTSMRDGVENADIVMIAVGTPPHPETHAADMKYIHAAASELAKYLTGYTVVATKSTVPVGTGDDIQSIILKNNPDADFDVISLPEFLREGFAVHDFFNPNRIIVGTDSERAKNAIRKMYSAFADKTDIVFVGRRSSETIKYASNAFLAMKIHYINEIADFCEKTGANITEVAHGMGMDTRIGPRFLNPGPGFGGSCFPKDTMAMSQMAQQYGVSTTLIDATIAGNANRKQKMAARIMDSVADIENPKIAVFGLAFKNGTDDCRESPAIEIVSKLTDNGMNITAYDPQAMNTAKNIIGDKISYATDMYDALKNADTLAILTEWDEFRTIDLKRAGELMRNRRIVDCRNLIDATTATAAGFEYRGIGIPVK